MNKLNDINDLNKIAGNLRELITMLHVNSLPEDIPFSLSYSKMNY